MLANRDGVATLPGGISRSVDWTPLPQPLSSARVCGMHSAIQASDAPGAHAPVPLNAILPFRRAEGRRDARHADRPCRRPRTVNPAPCNLQGTGS